MAIIYTEKCSSLQNYFKDISKYPLINTQKEIELSNAIKDGSIKAMHQLVQSNLRFVITIAKQYQNQGLSLSDLKQEGNIGLITAAEKFDATKGFKFITYAVWWIRQAIQEAIAEQTRIVRIPANQVASLNKYNKETDKFIKKHNRNPTIEELTEILESTEKQIQKTIRTSKRHISVDMPINEENENSLLNILENEEPIPDLGLHKESLNSEINRTLCILDNREKCIIMLIFGITIKPLSLEGIGEKFDMTSERIRQIRDEAIKKLKNSKNIELLKTFLT